MSEIVAFAGHRLIGRGDIAEVAIAMKRAQDAEDASLPLAFDAVSGRVVEVDLRGTEDDIRARLAVPPETSRGRGRPRLGVTSREVTLLPRHWEWLGNQRGGASAALRRLVDQARKAEVRTDEIRTGKEALYRFMTAMAGNEPGYEEAVRALYAEDHQRFVEQTRAWPADVREHTLTMANAAFDHSVPALEGTIANDRLADVDMALRHALPGPVIDNIEPLSGGGSGAGIFKVLSGDTAYVLRLDGPPDGFRDPARQYLCHEIAAEAGVAPRLIYSDASRRIAVIEHIEARQPTAESRPSLLGAALKRLHDAPRFPQLVPYFDGLRQLLHTLDASGIVPPGSLDQALTGFEALAEAYPEEEIVSSHNDLNPHNVLFTNEGAMFVDWESAFATDRYVDLATLINFFTSTESEESMLGEAYFGRPATGQELARLSLMRMANFLFYAAVLLMAAKREMPDLTLSTDELATPRFADARGTGLTQGTAREKAFSGCVFLNEAVRRMGSPAFAEHVAQL